MLDLVASPNTIHFVVDQEIVETTISLNSSQPVEKRTVKKKATQQTAWNNNKWGMLVRSRSRKADP
jgi:type II secretory pathway component GspD/PulD (secretin)